ncbi:hypothetical protein [Mucilaginibacter antarcticus]|uniref:Uncharacterized protein n=1 Tax=Mucilaginibacter antarcticus TaxID=1855725 RepID=A0ABW5XQB8_9SPHI
MCSYSSKGWLDEALCANPDEFIKMIGARHKGVYDERIVFSGIKIDGDLASVWAPYKFYLDVILGMVVSMYFS